MIRRRGRILVPLDTQKCPIEIFARVNAFAQHPGVRVLLLHVVNLNLAVVDRRIEAEVCREAQRCLGRLASHYPHPGARVLLRVRIGRPIAEVLAEAELPSCARTVLEAGSGF